MLPILLLLISSCSATTEWWGDLRAHLNPARQAPFYDVTYDEKVNVCPQGLHADAIPEYVYFGTMLATMTVEEHDQCLQKCAEKPRCKAVNFFHPFAYQEKGFCELLTEGQLDNPSLMRPFRKATYYEKIRCRELDDVEDVDEEITEKAPEEMVREKKLDMSKLMKKLSAKVKEFNGAGGFRAARR
uniref:Apple domain-containing protein n=1 Tax=Caenorhabditis tropicalis TaxID=1561998 RepID=A0A1I7TL14_9PELO